MRSNAARRAARNAEQNVAQPVSLTVDYDADRADRRLFEEVFGLPRHADTLAAVAPGHNVYLLDGVNIEDPKTGAVYSARKGRLLTVIAVDALPGERPVFHAAFRASEQKGGTSNHVLVQRALSADFISVRPVERGRRGGGNGSGSCPARSNNDGFRTIGKEAEIG